MSYTIPTEFDAIRPYSPEELPAAIEQLIADEGFVQMVAPLIAPIPIEGALAQLRQCRTGLEVQKVLFYPLLKKLIADKTAGASLDATRITDKTLGHTFISNHRDIIIDPAFTSVLMIDAGFPTTVEIAIGDNLLIHPWIYTLVRVVKSFIVHRSAGLRETLANSARMSRYIHFALNTKGENVWIAQREGRAKDGNDRTDTAVLKMLAMGGQGTPAECLKALRLSPMALSYEYDPCDYLKAKEFQQKRDNPAHKKSPADDLMNMQVGIFGDKGRVHFAMGSVINDTLDALGDLPKGEFFERVATHIDQQIHSLYQLYPINYVAADLLMGSTTFAHHYTAEERAEAEAYIEGRLALIDLPNKDEAFLRHKLLEMYANPAINHHAAFNA